MFFFTKVVLEIVCPCTLEGDGLVFRSCQVKVRLVLRLIKLRYSLFVFSVSFLFSLIFLEFYFSLYFFFVAVVVFLFCGRLREAFC